MKAYKKVIDNYGFNRLLEVNKHLILIAHKPINFLITSGDVLHSFAIPSFGIKVDAVPGRINTFYLEGSRVGKYYGACSDYVVSATVLCP
jgi:cytochrome c oxidase subunit 2